MKDKAPRSDISVEHSEIIEMAWCDDTSFDAIYMQTGLKEKEVIDIMRTYMKPSSFRMWRKRVSGRKAKHERKEGGEKEGREKGERESGNHDAGD